MKHIQKLRKLILTLGILMLAVQASFAASASYIDGSGTSQTVEATELETATTNWTDDSWYIVPADGLTISGRITVNGTVNLILRDGAALTASAGITTTNATLNIYAQSAGTGALTATGGNGEYGAGGGAGIGGGGGGYGSTGGAGGTVNIYGGIVTATGGNGGLRAGGGAGIGGGGGGGMRASGGAGGTVSIFGGTVTATGGNGGVTGGAGAGIGGGGKGYSGSDGASGTLTLGKGVKLYNGTDNTGTVLDDSDSETRSYSGNRTKTMFAEYQYSTGPDKSALNEAITAAETLYNSIKEVEDYSTIASTLSTAIDAAKNVAGSDTADQNAVDAATTAITTAKTNAEAAKKDVDDTTEANKVSTQIADLPAKEAITKDDKTKVDAVKAAYDELTDDQKKKVSDANKQKLNDAIAAIEKDKADTAAANAVIEKINALPATAAITSANKDAIEAARAAYDALTDNQKAKINDTVKTKLKAAETALVAAEFNEYKEAQKTAAANKAQVGDSDATSALITAAKATIDALTYDATKTLDENKAAVTAVVTKLATDIAAQRAAEQPVTVTAKADPSTTGTYYATFYDSTTSYTADCEVYYATANADGRLTLQKAEGNVIKAGEGVILKATSETVTLKPTTTEASYDSLLTGSDRETTVENALVLSHGKNGVWFYKYSGTLGANKAYLAQ